MTEAKQIFQTGFGWISPRGVQLAVEAFSHMEAIETWSEAAEQWAPFKDDLECIRKSCQELEDREGVSSLGEWHCLDMARENAHSKLAEVLYQAGFIRVGKSTHSQSIEFSGRPEVLISRMLTLRRIVWIYNEQHGTSYELRQHTTSL